MGVCDCGCSLLLGDGGGGELWLFIAIGGCMGVCDCGCSLLLGDGGGVTVAVHCYWGMHGGV